MRRIGARLHHEDRAGDTRACSGGAGREPARYAGAVPVVARVRGDSRPRLHPARRREAARRARAGASVDAQLAVAASRPRCGVAGARTTRRDPGSGRRLMLREIWVILTVATVIAGLVAQNA